MGGGGLAQERTLAAAVMSMREGTVLWCGSSAAGCNRVAASARCGRPYFQEPFDSMTPMAGCCDYADRRRDSLCADRAAPAGSYGGRSYAPLQLARPVCRRGNGPRERFATNRWLGLAGFARIRVRTKIMLNWGPYLPADGRRTSLVPIPRKPRAAKPSRVPHRSYASGC